MSKLKTIALGLATGAIIGYTTAKIKQPEYLLKEKEKTYVYSTKTKDKQEIHQQQNTFYVGNQEHNLEGAIQVAYQLGIGLKKQELEEKQQKIEYLEDKNKEQQKQIRNRRFFDRIDKLKDDINYWYQDLKRRQLE